MTEFSTSTNRDQLSALAAAHGVAVEYWDQAGVRHDVSDRTLTLVLAALGAPADSAAAVTASLDEVTQRHWRRRLPPLFVHRQSATGRMWVHLPHGNSVRAHLVWEDGSGAVPAVQIEHLVAPRSIDGELVGEAAFEIPPGLPLGYHQCQVRVAGDDEVAVCPLIVVPDRLPEVDPGWGLLVQLYAVRRPAAPIGDLGDLTDLVTATAAAGGDFVLINPVHAASPAEPIEPSPYLPVTRRFRHPIYLDVRNLPGGAPEVSGAGPGAPGAVDAPDAADTPLVAGAPGAVGASGASDTPVVAGASGAPDASDTPVVAGASGAVGESGAPDAVGASDAVGAVGAPGQGLIDWGAAWHAKRAVLRSRWDNGAVVIDDPDFFAYVQQQGVALQDFALWCALADEFGPRWEQWPPELRDVRGPGVTAAFARLEGEVTFYSWLQYLLDQQFAAVQDVARDAGMGLGVVHDLAVGVHGDGADTWRLAGLLASGVTVGAPPDMYNQRGQNWAQPPWQPRALADAAFVPYRDMIRAVLRSAGGVRVDHILGLYRQWWIPAGEPPADGTYVAMDFEALVGILLLEAHRAGAIVIGEDLGTVADWIRDDLAVRGILGTGVLWFEPHDGVLVAPESWRDQVLASVTVHDLPPTAGYLAGGHVALRDRLGLLTEPLAMATDAHDTEMAAWRDFLVQRGWLVSADAPTADVVIALHRCLAASPARLLGVSLPDVTGQSDPQNQPGTHREYPNWCIPLADADGTPVSAPQIPAEPLWAPIVQAVSRSTESATSPRVRP